jgi:hypothetical protein
MLCGSSHFYYSVTVSLENLEWKSEVENPFEFSVQNAVMSPIAMLGTENNIYFVGQCNRRMQHGVITSCFFQIHFNITLLYTHNSTSPKFLFYIFPKVFCNFFSFLLCILYDPPISSAITSSLLISSDQYISWSPLCCHFHPPVTFSPLCPNVPASTLLHSLSLCSDLVMTSFHIHTKQQVDITTIFYIPTSFGAKTLTKESITAHGTYPPPLQCENRNLSCPLKLGSFLFHVIKSSCPAGLHRVPIYRIRTSLATAALLCLFHISRGTQKSN